ncbi:hypothetical protein LCGC14_0651360 [marine sediment metagenome]|uniref:Uncharacterized protein n=1 Tax=marine sediment metagenome TaxID=412755 RepID=A0A0F9THW8_9ZZZZ
MPDNVTITFKTHLQLGEGHPTFPEVIGILLDDDVVITTTIYDKYIRAMDLASPFSLDEFTAKYLVPLLRDEYTWEWDRDASLRCWEIYGRRSLLTENEVSHARK